MRTNIAAVIWDIDGVMLENEWLHRQKNEAIAAEHGVVIRPEDWVALHGRGDHYIHTWLKERNPRFPISLDDYLSRINKYYIDNAHRLGRREGFTAVFNFLADNDIPQAAATNGATVQVNANLSAIGISVAEKGRERDAVGRSDQISSIVTADEVVNRKPAPDSYLKALERLSLCIADIKQALSQGKKVIAIEDSPSGASAGVAAGFTTIHWRLAQQDPIAPNTISVYEPTEFLKAVQELTFEG